MSQESESEASFLNGKTPVSCLQEVCTRLGIEPVYILSYEEGAAHAPIFTYAVSAGEKKAIGASGNKKRAKHNAALALLRLMNGISGPCDLQDSTSSSGGEAGSTSNAIGRLQETAQRNMWGLPKYEHGCVQGPAHAPNFQCTVHLRDLTATGAGQSKKIAKQNAAEQLLKKISSVGSVAQQPTFAQQPASAANIGQTNDVCRYQEGVSSKISELEYRQQFMTDDELRTTVESLRLRDPGQGGTTQIRTIDPTESQRISRFYRDLRTGLTEGHGVGQLAGEGGLSHGEVDCSMLLESIAKEHGFSATYVDLPELSAVGQHQCLLQLSTIPVAVLYGTGSTSNRAHSLAAHSALQYLKIMTKSGSGQGKSGGK